MNLTVFQNKNLFEAGTDFFKQLGITLNSNTTVSLDAKKILKDQYKDRGIFEKINETYFLGLVDDSVFDRNVSLFDKDKISYEEATKKINAEYNGIMVFGVKCLTPIRSSLPTGQAYSPKRSDIAELTRAFNRVSKNIPVVLLLQYGNLLSFTTSERTGYKQKWREGEKIGKISLLKDIDIFKPHAGHLKILHNLKVRPEITGFSDLYKQWKEVFNVQLLNKNFYDELSAWYYCANFVIKLPIKPEYCQTDKENIKNFVVRLICRIVFCWFLKEKGLIEKELLELYDYSDENKIILVEQDNKQDFDKQNSYYRCILQNIFFSCLNTPMDPVKGRPKNNYFGKKYLPENFDYSLFDKIPFLNGGLFDKLEEDYCNDIFEDGTIVIPNELFYAKKLDTGTGRNAKKTQGLNRILAKYKFTIDENTPLEEEIALDPELLGLVFENLLAEIDPDEAIAKTARKESGSFYTPRKVIDYMVNESLLLYSTNFFKQKGYDGYHDKLNRLIYFDRIDDSDDSFKSKIVDALDNIKVLDPACGSGAFPMGMLHRIVAILKIVDSENHLWLNKQLSRIEDKFQQDNFKKILSQHLDDYSRKLGIVKNAIYGIDNQPLAVQITKLRFFISLIIDQNVDLNCPEENYHLTPLPNLETKIICADSLRDLRPSLFDETSFEKLLQAKEEYYQPDLSAKNKERIAHEIAEIMAAIFPSFTFQITGKKLKDRHSEAVKNKEYIKKWFQNANLCAPFFSLDVFFPELIHKPFDIVIGNPPYGGKNIPDEVKEQLEIGKKDPYGAFIARFIGDGVKITPLKNRGILALIVSDTFMTIKTHFQLRKQMMNNYIHKMIRVHPDTFKATVNTAIIICERNVFSFDLKREEKKIDPDHHCQMVDLTNISIHENYDRFLEVLYKTEGFEERENISNSEYAIYYYLQSLVKTNSNLPFFVASPKLFKLMNDINAPTEYKEINNKNIQIRKIKLNGKKIELIKLGQIAEIKQGLATGDNDAYLFQNPDARGNYRNIQDYKDYVLREVDINKIINDNHLRMEIIEKGISKDNPESDRFFGGRYILPYDKGGESDSDEGWMPNYYVLTNYFIDWSEWAVNRLKQYTIAQRIVDNKENKVIKEHYKTTTCAVIRSPNTFFCGGITFSRTGIYAPTFRLNAKAVYDTEGSTIFIKNKLSDYLFTGIVASNLSRYIIKNYIGHTVHCQVDELKELPGVLNAPYEIGKLVQLIVDNQKKNIRYDYVSNEQIEIDKLVYGAYGLNEEDIKEVENWYTRRYPKLAKAQKNNKSKAKNKQ